MDGFEDGVKDEEVDEDAINSDLDDPDDDQEEDDDDDDSMGHIMLCMYDKVQRVKNKWYVFTSFACPRRHFTDIITGSAHSKMAFLR